MGPAEGGARRGLRRASLCALSAANDEAAEDDMWSGLKRKHRKCKGGIGGNGCGGAEDGDGKRRLEHVNVARDQTCEIRSA